MPFQIFLSSTYRDLIAERQAVEQVIVALGQHFKGMEHFFAREEIPLETCLAEVALARPHRRAALRRDRCARHFVHRARVLVRG